MCIQALHCNKTASCFSRLFVRHQAESLVDLQTLQAAADPAARHRPPGAVRGSQLLLLQVRMRSPLAALTEPTAASPPVPACMQPEQAARSIQRLLCPFSNSDVHCKLAPDEGWLTADLQFHAAATRSRAALRLGRSSSTSWPGCVTLIAQLL